MNSIKNPLHRQLMRYATLGFVALALGYVLRGQVGAVNPVVALLLGVFPNLLGSFATPFLLGTLLDQRFPSVKALDRFWVFALVNLFTLAVSVLIEYLHIVAGLGVWDWNDIVASGIGGAASLVLFSVSRSLIKTV